MRLETHRNLRIPMSLPMRLGTPMSLKTPRRVLEDSQARLRRTPLSLRVPVSLKIPAEWGHSHPPTPLEVLKNVGVLLKKTVLCFFKTFF